MPHRLNVNKTFQKQNKVAKCEIKALNKDDSGGQIIQELP